jgi:hypothetical protein
MLLRQKAGLSDQIAQGREELRVDVRELVDDVVREVRDAEVVVARLSLAAASAIDIRGARTAVRTSR